MRALRDHGKDHGRAPLITSAPERSAIRRQAILPSATRHRRGRVAEAQTPPRSGASVGDCVIRLEPADVFSREDDADAVIVPCHDLQAAYARRAANCRTGDSK